MASFTFGAVQPLALTSLNAVATGLTVAFTWDAQAVGEKVEIWKSTTTTQSSAVLVAATWDHNFQESENAGSNTNYYWLRKANTVQGGQYGPWSSMITVVVTGVTASATIANGSITPAMLGSGITAINNTTGALASGVVASTNLATTTVTTSGTGSSGGGTSAVNTSTLGVWNQVVYTKVVPATNDFINMFMYLTLAVNSPVVTGTQWLQGFCRFRLHDNTTGNDVPAGTDQFLFYNAAFGTTGAQMVPIMNYNKAYTCGFRGLMIPGHSYYIYGEVMLQATSGSPTGSLIANGYSSLSAASIY